jgi:DNA-directed RNA polymerase specialized sigma subunit
MAIQPNSKMTNDREMTQQEIADALGISRIAVYQIEMRAFEKLRKALKRKNIKPTDLIA